MSRRKPMNGAHFRRALEYALQACPKPDDPNGALAHVVLLGNSLICADGARWHRAYLPDGATVSGMAITRESARELLLGLEYAQRMSRGAGGGFAIEFDGPVATIHYGEKEIEHELTQAVVGHLPSEFVEPVPADAPAVSTTIPGAQPVDLRCGHFDQAIKWDKTGGLFTLRANDKAIRVDVQFGEDRVATAYLLPNGKPLAALPPTGPLMDKAMPEHLRGQSVLSLQLDLFKPSASAPTPKQEVRIGEKVIDCTGLAPAFVQGLPRGCARPGTDGHVLAGSAEMCATCTSEVVQIERARLDLEAKELAAKVTPIGAAKKRRGSTAKGKADKPPRGDGNGGGRKRPGGGKGRGRA